LHLNLQRWRIAKNFKDSVAAGVEHVCTTFRAAFVVHGMVSAATMRAIETSIGIVLRDPFGTHNWLKITAQRANGRKTKMFLVFLRDLVCHTVRIGLIRSKQHAARVMRIAQKISSKSMVYGKHSPFEP
jgi:hypothetical protein